MGEHWQQGEESPVMHRAGAERINALARLLPFGLLGGGQRSGLGQKRRSLFASVMSLALVLTGPLLAVYTWSLMRAEEEAGFISDAVRRMLLLDLIYILLIAALILWRVVSLVRARRRYSVGARLHARLSVVFAGVALGPAVLLAVFAAVTLNFGLQSWFSERVGSVVGASLAAAQAYEDEERRDLIADTILLARYLDRQIAERGILAPGEIRLELSRGQAGIQRGLKEAYVIDSAGTIRARGDRSYLFDFEPPSHEELAEAQGADPVVIEDWPNNEFRALTALSNAFDQYLYVSRRVDGEILSLLDDTRETVRFYNRMESERGQLLFDLGLIYLGFALIVVLAAVWLGLWLAERLARPVARLAEAAQRVGEGDFDVRVIEAKSDDEIALLGRAFNRMTRQVKRQRDDLVEAHERTERRRRLFDNVLSNVTAGVIGLRPDRSIEITNQAACEILALEASDLIDKPLEVVIPEFSALLELLHEPDVHSKQSQIRLLRAGKSEILLVRAAERGSEGATEGYVMTFDDVTDLVSAQRMAAWGDVARRIAHEVKNPLTPIQLSSERLKRKFGPMLEEKERASLTELSDVIIRQTNDLRRIVDEFSRFARMPEPERRRSDFRAVLRDVVTLHRADEQEGVEGRPAPRLSLSMPDAPLMMLFDETQINQALTNLIKNALEAVEAKAEALDASGDATAYAPEVQVSASVRPEGRLQLMIADNGIGLPRERARLFEPYVTTRARGTGLGLSIVKKIIEEHGGTLRLLDAPPIAPATHQGALALIELPLDEGDAGAAPTEPQETQRIPQENSGETEHG